MAIRGPLDHIDLTIRDPERSIPFYETFFSSLGYERLQIDHPGFGGDHPQRAAWFVQLPGVARVLVGFVHDFKPLGRKGGGEFRAYCLGNTHDVPKVGRGSFRVKPPPAAAPDPWQIP